jgi:integrase
MKVNLHPHKTLSGWYTLDWRPDGVKGKRERLHVEGYSNAEARKESLEYIGLEKPDAVTFPRLKSVYAEYLEWCRRNLSESTNYVKVCRFEKHIIPALGEYRVRDLSQRIFDGYSKGIGKGSYRMDVNHIKALVKWMVKRQYAELLTFQPELPSNKSKIKVLPTAQEIQTLIAAIKFEHHRVVCMLMLYTGLRWNEARRLRWENYRNGAILLKVSKTDDPEIITIPSPCLPFFEANKQAAGYIFSNTQGKTFITRLMHPLRMAEKATGIHLTPHMFRHASATFLYELTGDIYAVQHHLRHSRVTTSQIYTRYSAVRRKGSVDALVGALNPPNIT